MLCQQLCNHRNNVLCNTVKSSDPDLAECFLEHPEFDDEGGFFNFETIECYQQKSAALQAKPDQEPDRFHRLQFGSAVLDGCGWKMY